MDDRNVIDVDFEEVRPPRAQPHTTGDYWQDNNLIAWIFRGIHLAVFGLIALGLTALARGML